jgi:glutamate 5-kinase
MTSLVIGAVGAGLIVVGVAALRRQAKATSCPKHSHAAGRLAVILAWACMIAGAGALVAAVVVYRTNQEPRRRLSLKKHTLSPLRTRKPQVV